MSFRRRQTTSRLRQRLMLQQEVRLSDDAGGFTRSWQDIVELWAEIIPITGKEKLFGGQLESALTHRILLRYRSGVLPGQRLVFESRAFNIRFVANSREADETLELLAEEGVAT